MKKYKVFIDGVASEITRPEFDLYNVIHVRGGISGSTWNTIEPHSEKDWRSVWCPIFQKEFSYRPTHLTTQPCDEFVFGSSQVSNS